MNKEAFAQRLLVALGHSKFDLDVSAIKMLDSNWLGGALLSPIRFTNVQGAAKADQLKREFDAMNQYTPLLAFKFVLGQPLVACVIEGDLLPGDKSILAANTFYGCINNCMPYTLKPHGTVIGFLIFVFFENGIADTFVYDVQQRCRYETGGGKFTAVRPWAIDVPSKRVTAERKTWLYTFSGFDPKKFSKDLFGA